MRPKRILVMRHAESQEDIDKSVYEHTSDLDIDLSELGQTQARDAGSVLLSQLAGDNVHFYISPGLRLKRTYDLLVGELPATIRHSFTIEPLILKQFWGDVTVTNRRTIEIARYKEGVLVYRFPNGESGPELVERFHQFARNLRRDFKQPDCCDNIVILTHGFEMRVFLMVWLGLDIPTFETLANPRNCEIATLERDGAESYALLTPLRRYDPATNPLHVNKLA